MRLSGPKLRAALFVALAMLPFTSQATDSNVVSSRQKYLSDIVNTHAIKGRMIVGVERSDGSCKIELQSEFHENTSIDLQRIFNEILKSPVRDEIRRFNQPRSSQDRSTFDVNEETCAIRSYKGSPDVFRPPSRQGTSAFKLTYSPAIKAAKPQLEIWNRNARVRLVAEQDSLETRLDVSGSANATCCTGNSTVVLMHDGKELADWDRDEWSVVKNVRAGNYQLRVQSPSGVAKLEEGDIVSFRPGMIISVHEKTATGVRELAAMQIRTTTSRPAYVQGVKGRGVWDENPSAFDIQVVAALKSAGNHVKESVQLTFDKRSIHDVRGLLKKSEQRLSRQVQTSKNRLRPVYGSIAILNGKTGAVYVAEGFPTVEEPTRYRSGEFGVTSEPGEAFKRRVVGSVAKVPLGFAVLMAHPELKDLRVESKPSSEFDTILGQSIEPALPDGNMLFCGNQIDFSCFIRKSSNRYAATLLGIAASLPQQGIDNLEQGTQPLLSDRFWLSDGTRSRRFDMQPAGFLYKNSSSMDRIERLPWVREAGKLYDVSTRFDSGSSLSPPAHTYVWRNAFRTKPPDWAMHGFVPISPERENLRLNLANDFRTNYLLLILGGGESRWSAIKIAETFARIVNLTQVQASFVYPEMQPERFRGLLDEPNAQRLDAHRILLTGLRMVASTGTAPWLGTALNEIRRDAQLLGLELHVYAKTGTPRVDTFVSSEREEIIRTLFQKGTLAQKSRTEDSGADFYYAGKKLDLNTVSQILSGTVGDFRTSALRREILHMFAVLNRESGINQRTFCNFRGVDVRCAENDVLTKNKDDGRNLVVYLETRRGERICNAISMAYSHSVKSQDDLAFKEMVSRSLKRNGPVARHLLPEDSSACDA